MPEDAQDQEARLIRREASHRASMQHKGDNYIRLGIGLAAIGVIVSFAVEFAWSLFAGAAVSSAIGLWLRIKNSDGE